MGLFYIDDLQKQTLRVGLLLIDMFTKHGCGNHLINDETGLITQTVPMFFKGRGHSIAHHGTGGRPNFSEKRRTYKNMFHKRAEAHEMKEKQNTPWADHNH